MQLFFGILLVPIGIFMVIKSEWMLQAFGRIAWAEEHLGLDGGTRLFYKLLGIIFIFFGMTLILGLFGGIVSFVFSPLIRK